MNRLTWVEALLSLLSGVLTAFAMPGFGAFPLVFVALVPLFFVLEKRGGFWAGSLFGLAFFAVDLRWILTLIRFHPIVVGGYILLIVYFAIGCGILTALITWRGRTRASTWILLAPAVFVLAEFLRTLGPLGMGFSALYQTLYRVPLLIQSAAWLGPWFVSGMLVAVNGAVFLSVRRRSLRYAAVAAGVVIVLGAFAWIPDATRDSGTLDVAAISSKVRQEVKLDARNLNALADRYLALGERALGSTPDVLVFPESILPSYILQNETLMESFADLARQGDARVLLGTGVYRDRAIYNTVALFSQSGELTGTYAMVRPVPFGEYIPGRRMLEWLGLGAWARSFLPVDLSRGDAYAPLEEFGTPICFESTFPGPSRQFVRNGAQVLVTLTNDAWFAESSELAAHFSCAVFRAVENRRFVVQAANGGISGIVSPRGDIIESLDGEGIVTAQVGLRTEMSLYTRWGDWLVLGVACGLAAGILVRRTIART